MTDVLSIKLLNDYLIKLVVMWRYILLLLNKYKFICLLTSWVFTNSTSKDMLSNIFVNINELSIQTKIGQNVQDLYHGMNCNYLQWIYHNKTTLWTKWS